MASQQIRARQQIRASLFPTLVILLSNVRLASTLCQTWCNQWTCAQQDCSSCIDGCGRPFSPPPDGLPPTPPPAPPELPPTPWVPLNSIGVRRADYWAEQNMLFTNAFTGTRQSLAVKGASWFGLEGNPCFPGGAPQARIDLNMKFLRENGFNALRVPLALDAVLDTPVWEHAKCQGHDGLFYTFNPEFIGLGYMGMLSKFIQIARDHGLLVMLDIHTAAAGVWPEAGTMGVHGGQRLMGGWSTLATHLCEPEKYWNVFAADIRNEPHGMYWGPLGPGASYPEQERWDTIAASVGDAILRLCPRWLIFVEGVGHCMVNAAPNQPCPDPSAYNQDVSTPTWWGENLQAALEYPVTLSAQHKLVYSPHVYGPSVFMQPYFKDPRFPANMAAVWNREWGYIARAKGFPIVLGEWGGLYKAEDQTWQDAMAAFLKDPDNGIAGSFYWCVNPESHDTGGLFKSWSTTDGAAEPDQAKLQLLAGLPSTPVPLKVTLPPMSPSPKRFSPPPMGPKVAPDVLDDRPLAEVYAEFWLLSSTEDDLPSDADSQAKREPSNSFLVWGYRSAIALLIIAGVLELWRHCRLRHFRFFPSAKGWVPFASWDVSTGVGHHEYPQETGLADIQPQEQDAQPEPQVEVDPRHQLGLQLGLD